MIVRSQASHLGKQRCCTMPAAKRRWKQDFQGLGNVSFEDRYCNIKPVARDGTARIRLTGKKKWPTKIFHTFREWGTKAPYYRYGFTS